MASPRCVFARNILSKINLSRSSLQEKQLGQNYSKKCGKGECGKGECRRAMVDIPVKPDPKCPLTCERIPPKKQGILHKIKLKVIEGGTNFGTPFRRIQVKEECGKGAASKQSSHQEALPERKKETKRKLPAKLEQLPGMQVSIIGADTAIGQYTALLLKKCSTIKRLRLYEAVDTKGSQCHRDLQSVVQDLKHINTNCQVQAFSCSNNELGQSLANADIVLLLDSGYLNARMPLEQRFSYQAPIVRKYAEAIATECPKAFVIVGATPVDCMVPLIAESLKENGWYDQRRLLGSMAVPEMRASTLAARVLALEPKCTRVPCVGGSEGEALVPLFSKAVDYFDFSLSYAQSLTESVRTAAAAVDRKDGPCAKAADLSDAHALAGLIAKVANGLLCIDVPIVSGFVETDPTAVVSSVRYMAVDVSLNKNGICKRYEFPPNLSDLELYYLEKALECLNKSNKMAMDWFYQDSSIAAKSTIMKKDFLLRRRYDRLERCSFNLT